VFVVGYLGDWRRAAAVLFDRESVSGHPPPRREAGQGAAPTLSARTRGGGGLGTDFDCDGGLVQAFGGGNTSGPIEAAACLTAKGHRCDFEVETFAVAHTLKGEGFDDSEDGTGRGTPIVPVCFSAKDHGADAMSDLSPTLRAGGHSTSHANAGVMPAVAFAIQERAVCENPDAGPDGAGFRGDGAAYTLEARSVPQAVAFAVRGREGGAMPEVGGEVSNTLRTPGGGMVAASAVRRLTPRECERLQGFPDDWTLIPWRNKPASECPDGPRYKSLGNSWAVNCARWIGERIEAVEAIVADQVDQAELEIA